MKHYDEAIRYIQVQSEGAQKVLDFVSARFSSPRCAGCCSENTSARAKKASNCCLTPPASSPACRHAQRNGADVHYW
jgi:sensor histidine kinase regulating citrate/malate metabolism